MNKVSDLVKKFTDEKLKKDFNNNPGLFLINYSGVSSADLTVLRRDLTSFGSKMFIVKNSYIDVALKDIDKGKEVKGMMSGPTALIFIDEDPVGPAKVLTDFAKTHDSLKLRGGYIRDRLLEVKDFKMLASIPPREILYQQIAVACNGPVTKLAQSLNQIVTKLCYALKAISDKKENK